MTSPAPGRCRPAAPPAPRPAPAAPPRRRIRPPDQDLRRPRPTASPPPSRRPCRQTSLTTGRRQEDLTAGRHPRHIAPITVATYLSKSHARDRRRRRGRRYLLPPHRGWGILLP